jgi:hypothetical protein
MVADVCCDGVAVHISGPFAEAEREKKKGGRRSVNILARS